MGTVEETDNRFTIMGQTGSEKETFYGVHIPNSNDDHFLHVYTDKAEAFKVVKHHKKARFKAFYSRLDAVNFAVHGSDPSLISDDGCCGSGTSADAEKPSPFKGPKSQDLVQFRRAVESGNLELVFRTVWDNPRYLVSSGDTPSILQEGSRYNALHVSAKSKNANMADLILHTIGDPAFCRLLYGEESSDKTETNIDRVEMLLDLYLNTPDKGMHETPLHFASKFGAVQVVAVLLSYPQCDRLRKNKFGQMPVDIICARCSEGNEKSKKEILHLLESEFYVPVLRAEDNSLPPSVGAPFSPKRPPMFKEDPTSPRLEIHAFAGPMKRTQADKFHRDLKIPQRPTEMCSSSKKVIVRDPERGLERSGRELAEYFNVPWKEYWPFLGTFVDLASPEGLDCLEAYLRQRFEDSNKVPGNECLDKKNMKMKADYSQEVLRVDESFNSSGVEPEVLSPVTQLCTMMKACNILDDSIGSEHSKSCPSSTATNGNVRVSSSLRVFDWLSRKRPAVEKNVPADDQNEAILAALSQPNLSPFLYVEKSLQLFAKRIAASLHHTVSGSQNYPLTDAIRDVLKPEMKKVQSLVSSYMEDARFVAVDYHLVHSRVASSVAERLVAQLTSEEREIFYNILQVMLSTRGHLDGTLSSDDEDIPPTSTPYRQSRLVRQSGSSHQKTAIRCIISRMVWALDLLQGSGPDGRSPLPPRPQVQSESECLEIWSDAYSCSCTWPSLNQSNFSRNSRKSSSMKRSFNNSTNVESVNRRLFNNQGDDEEGDTFFTPPSSPVSVSPIGDILDVSDDELTDPEEGPVVFIEGSEPTRMDTDVLNAICSCDITPSTYPHIYRWRHGVLLYSPAERKRWRTRSVLYTEHTPLAQLRICSADTPIQTPPNDHLNGSPIWSRVTGLLSPRQSSRKAKYFHHSSPVL